VGRELYSVRQDEGRAIDVKTLSSNTPCSIRDNFESAPIVTGARDVQNAKKSSQMTSTDPEIATDVKPVD
jgi:hypothetical protein